VRTRQHAAEIELVVRCDCGFEARGTEDTLVPLVQRHGREAHKMEVSREQVLAMARPV
jgi:predicted small metal-binding protein